MKTCSAAFLEKDHDLTAGILPEVYFRSPSVKDFEFPWYEKAPFRQTTEVRTAWSLRFFYIHFWASDTFVTARETRPKTPFPLDDSLSVFLQPSGSSYWVWEVNALGTLHDYKVPGVPDQGLADEGTFDRKGKTHAQWKTARHPAGWTLELRIPWEKEVGAVPFHGASWKIAFNRVDVDNRSQIALSSWSELPAETVGFHQASVFGELKFL